VSLCPDSPQDQLLSDYIGVINLDVANQVSKLFKIRMGHDSLNLRSIVLANLRQVSGGGTSHCQAIIRGFRDRYCPAASSAICQASLYDHLKFAGVYSDYL